MDIVGEGERALFRSLVHDNGVYEKDKTVEIVLEDGTRADYAAQGRRNGTVVNVAIRIYPDVHKDVHASANESDRDGKDTREDASGCASMVGSACIVLAQGTAPCTLQFTGKESTYDVEVTVLRDTGQAYEVAMACIQDAVQRKIVPDMQSVFSMYNNITGDIYENKAYKDKAYKNKECSTEKQTNTQIHHRTQTYGVVDSTYFVAPINQEYVCSDAIVHVETQGKYVRGITIQQGGIDADVLANILDAQTSTDKESI